MLRAPLCRTAATFKGGDAKTLFSVYTNLRIELDDFDYKVNAERNQNEKIFIIKNLYSQQLTEMEMQKIVDEKANSVLAQIKDQYKRLTGKEL